MDWMALVFVAAGALLALVTLTLYVLYAEQHRTRLRADRQRALEESLAAQEERNRAVSINDTLQIQRDTAVLERDAAVSLKARCQQELQEVTRDRTLLRAALDSLPHRVGVRDLTGRYLLTNHSLRQALSRYDAVEIAPPAILSGTDLAAIRRGDPIRRIRTDGDEQNKPHWWDSRYDPLQLPDGTVWAFTDHATDITAQKETEYSLEQERGRLQALSSRDSTTGLGNRHMLMGYIRDVMTYADRPPAIFILCDLDHFKWVNDSVGHDVGDHLLFLVGQRFQEVVGDKGVLARFGGDEFAVFCSGMVPYDGMALSRGMLRALEVPFEVEGQKFSLAASIGVAALRVDHDRADALIRDADLAMYRAKEQGRNEVALYDDILHARMQRRLQLSQGLRAAMLKDEVALVFQPMVDVVGQQLTGFEALARWRYGGYGAIAPDEFIRLAEEAGHIGTLGISLLRQACWQLRHWQKRYSKANEMVMSVNVSPRQLDDPKFADDVASVLQQTGVPAESLQLEITESTLMANPAQVITQLGDLSSLGIRLAIDDFGTGYSSLAYLRRFPVDVLKIDRSFIADADRDAECQSIIRLVVGLADSLDLEVVAEGVERETQALLLKEMGCHKAQGYYYARPLPGAAAARWLD